jgi:D-arabinose 1-dehydrogenase-like Zn-dependent alcohol dehydrogenase
MDIRAYAINEMGGTAEPFLYERTIGSREVLVKITHRSLARGDIQFIDTAWGDTRFPLVPSHEIVGIVEDAGSGVADLHTGDRVGIGYQQEACFECSFCTQGIEPTLRQPEGHRRRPLRRFGRTHRRRFSIRFPALAAA